jgi:hypothetical protein
LSYNAALPGLPLSLNKWATGTLAVLCIGVLASFVASEVIYKIWYIAAAIACCITLLLVVSGGLRIDGLVQALVPVLVYFLYLTIGSVWAAHARTTLTWVAIDAVELAIVALFYVWALNGSGRQICMAMMVLAFVCLPINVILSLTNQDAIRFGSRGLAVLPILVPFCWVAWQRYGSKLALPAIAVVLGMLFVSRSRTPLGAAVIGLGLSVLATSKNRREIVRSALWILLGLTCLLVILLAVPPTRPWLAWTFSRLLYRDIEIGDVVIEAEAIDEVRWAVFFAAIDVWWSQQPLGMGYMNFMLWFEQHFGIPMNLHMSLQTWAVEGGLPCLAIMVWIFARYFRLLSLPSSLDDADGEALALALGRAMVVILILGFFHQPHQAPAMYALLGMGYAFWRRYKRPQYLLPRTSMFADSGSHDRRTA